MSTVLQVLGVVLIVLLVLVLIGYLAVRLWFRRLGNRLEDALEGLSFSTPARITLVPESDPQWADEAGMQRYAAPLASLGFREAGLWTADEMPGLLIASFVQPTTDVIAVVYEHSAAGIVLDMVSRYADDTTITCTTSADAGNLDQWPGHAKIALPGADTAALYQRMLDDRPDGELLPAVASEFKQVFERAYADEMDWRMDRGGATEEEVRRIALSSGEEYSDEVLAETLEMQKRDAMANLDQSLLEHFIEETTMSVAEWERHSGMFFFIHDRLDAGMLQTMFEEWTDEEAVEYDWPGELPPREQFAAAIAQLPESKRPEKIGTVSAPVEADVYSASQAGSGVFSDEEW